MRARAEFVYKAVGGVFLLLGVITFLNLVVAWDGAHVILWQGFGYLVIDCVVAYGCFYLERWILYAFAANTGTLIALWLIAAATGAPLSLLPLIMILCSGILAAYAYKTRRFLRATAAGYVAAVLFFLSWGSTIIYSVIIELHLI